MKYIIFLLALSFFYAVRAQEVTIPYVENFIADGDPREWEIITDPEKLHADPFGSAHLPEDFSARIFLGWDERGICFLFEVTDNEIWRNAILNYFYQP